VKKKKIRLESKVSRKYICENFECKKVFSKIENRKRHMLNVHKVNVRHKCTICYKHFRDQYNLERHLRIQHSKKKVKTNYYKCPMCSFKTRFKCSLIRHEKAKHQSIFNQDGELVCEICKQTFTEKSLIKQHTTIHDAIRIGYNCVFCDSEKLENHICVFRCQNCDRTFNSKALLNSHLKIHDKLDNVTNYLTKIGEHDELKTQILCIKY